MSLNNFGVDVKECNNSYEAIKKANLNWNVITKQVYFKNNNQEYIPTDNYLTVREDTETALGIVSKKYTPIQNIEAFEFCDELLSIGKASYERAGYFKEGKIVYLLANLNDYIVIGNDDKTAKYLLIANSHDGTMSLKAFFTPIRVICENTLRMALAKAETQVSIVHMGNIKKKVSEAQRVLEVSLKYFDYLKDKFKTMYERTVTDKEVKDYFKSIYESDTKVSENIRNELFNLYMYGKGAVPYSLWGAYNAVIEYLDYHKNYKDEEKRLLSNNFANGLYIKTEAFNKAVKLTQEKTNLISVT